MFLCLWTWIPRQRPPVTAAARSDVTHTRRSGCRGQDVSAIPTGRTDGLHKVGSLRRPHRCTHHSTQDTRGPGARTGTHGTHGRQARHTHPRDAAPATQTRTPAAVKMFTRRGQDVCANDPRPAGRTDARHQVGHAAPTTDTHGHPQGLRDPGGHRDLPVWLGPETPALGRRPVAAGLPCDVTGLLEDLVIFLQSFHIFNF